MTEDLAEAMVERVARAVCYEQPGGCAADCKRIGVPCRGTPGALMGAWQEQAARAALAVSLAEAAA